MIYLYIFIGWFVIGGFYMGFCDKSEELLEFQKKYMTPPINPLTYLLSMLLPAFWPVMLALSIISKRRNK
ncbi:hypothetical protein [uncultured Pseudodesulfovibrio sp.]|uniref:hypothetical protein n=1 Tax=uncultured Pseudodesulfovibrio sp. TaxID=2035858 RepID=UPI0029C94A60|nr:hypothetical protein [uncultured Pseudodesulfovibrio sp.]